MGQLVAKTLHTQDTTADDNIAVNRRRFFVGGGLGLATAAAMTVGVDRAKAQTSAPSDGQAMPAAKPRRPYPIKFKPLEEYRKLFSCIKFERKDGILTATFHNNGGEFVWSVAAHHEVAMMWNYIGEDPENKIIILTGTGNNFLAKTAYEPEIFKGMDGPSYILIAQDGKKILNDLVTVEQPIICALNGPVHMHSQIPMLCDLVIATPDMTIRDHHIPYAAPADGHNVVWPLVFGLHRSNYAFLMQKAISCQEAKDLGLVSEIVERTMLLARANEIARTLLKIDPVALRVYRQTMMQPIKQAMLEGLSLGIMTTGYGFVGR